MLVYKGKYAVAKVMIDAVEPALVQQLYSFLNHPAFAKCNIVIMPDCHAGKGAVVGFTSTLNEYVIPNVVGVDIGCGVDAYNLGKIDINLEAFDQFIRQNIPNGHNVHEDMTVFNQYGWGALKDSMTEICERTNSPIDRMLKSYGTLGGGNHFIELDKDHEDNIWLLIHSGSRKFGLDIANYHQGKAKDLMKQMFIGSAYKDLEFLSMGHGAEEYLKDMEVAQRFAWYNRQTMAGIIMGGALSINEFKGKCIRSIHNYIDLEAKIIRKGATTSIAGELLVIPLNMRDGTIVAMGMSNSAWNNSAPHGAGRIMSRKRAKELITLSDYQETMKGVWSSCISNKTIDEAPMAYKDQDLIISAIQETAQIQFIMKPIYNFKASE